MSLAEKLKAARKLSGLGQVAFATRFGVTQGFISQIESGRKKTIPPGLAGQIAAGVGLPPDHFEAFLSAQGRRAVAATVIPDPLPYRVPLLGVVAAGLGDDETFEHDHWLSVPDECKGANAAYRVRGLSMRDVGILDGDYLFVRANDQPDHGAFVVAWLHDTGNVVKRLERKGKRDILHSADGTADPRYPYTMTPADKFWGQLIATFRSYRVTPAQPKGRGKK